MAKKKDRGVVSFRIQSTYFEIVLLNNDTDDGISLLSISDSLSINQILIWAVVQQRSAATVQGTSKKY